MIGIQCFSVCDEADQVAGFMRSLDIQRAKMMKTKKWTSKLVRDCRDGYHRRCLLSYSNNHNTKNNNDYKYKDYPSREQFERGLLSNNDALVLTKLEKGVNILYESYKIIEEAKEADQGTLFHDKEIEGAEESKESKFRRNVCHLAEAVVFPPLINETREGGNCWDTESMRTAMTGNNNNRIKTRFFQDLIASLHEIEEEDHHKHYGKEEDVDMECKKIPNSLLSAAFEIQRAAHTARSRSRRRNTVEKTSTTTSGRSKPLTATSSRSFSSIDPAAINREERCVICWEDLDFFPSSTNPVARLKRCGHYFHNHCLNKAKIYTTKCPICKQTSTGRICVSV